MPLEKTLTANHKVRINPQYPVVAGVDDDKVPRILKVDSDGRLDLGGITIPPWDQFEALYYGATNNVSRVTWKKDGNEVARFDLTYTGGAANDDDNIAGGVFTLAT